MRLSGLGRFATAAILATIATRTADAGGTLYVDGGSPPGGDGLSWATAIQKLDDALASAAKLGATEIWVREGMYVPLSAASADPRSRRFLVPNGVALLGGFAGNETNADERDIASHPTVLSGDLAGNDQPGFANRSDNSYHVVEAPDNAVVTLDGLAVRGGFASGTSLALRRGGGAKFQGGLVTLRECTFTDNWAYLAGGGFYSQAATLIAKNCTALGNRVGSPSDSTDNHGGGLCVVDAPSVQISESYFSGNAAAPYAGYGSGAAITRPLGTVMVTSCTFLQNVASDGALEVAMFNGSSGPVTVASCSFVANGPVEPGIGSGGGVRVQGDPFTSTPITFTDCSFRANHCDTSGGGGAKVTSVASTFDGCEFIDNMTSGSGGGVAAADRPASFSNCLFDGNSCAGSGGGCSATASITHCIFRGNASAVAGGGLECAATNATAVILTSLFEGNWAQSRGGAISASGNVSVDRSRLIGNIAWERGGGLATLSSNVTVSDSLLASNQAPFGGGLAVTAGTLTVHRCTVVSNSSDQPGGGIWKSGSTLSIDGSIVWGNRAASLGGLDAQLEISPSGEPTASLTLSWSDLEGGDGVGIESIAADPQFVDTDGPDGLSGTADDDYGLRFDSPCINRAKPGPFAPGAMDAAGLPRRQQCRVDMGALESPHLPINPPDCNGNGIADECDVDSGFDPDCDGDGIPNSCEIAAGASDCDRDGVPDICQLAQSQGDCDGDGVFDACEIVAGSESDCNGDDIPDDCQVGPVPFAVVSPQSTPFGFGAPAVFDILSPLAPTGPVTITLKAKADLSATDEFVTLSLNGTVLGTAFVLGGDCPSLPNVATFTLSRDEWLGLVGTGNATLLVEATSTVDPGLCASWLTIAVSYSSVTPLDADANGAIDSCEHPGDLNGDFAVNAADLAILLEAWGPCSGCPADFDHDGHVGPLDLALLLGDWT